MKNLLHQVKVVPYLQVLGLDEGSKETSIVGRETIGSFPLRLDHISSQYMKRSNFFGRSWLTCELKYSKRSTVVMLRCLMKSTMFYSALGKVEKSRIGALLHRIPNIRTQPHHHLSEELNPENGQQHEQERRESPSDKWDMLWMNKYTSYTAGLVGSNGTVLTGPMSVTLVGKLGHFEVKLGSLKPQLCQSNSLREQSWVPVSMSRHIDFRDNFDATYTCILNNVINRM